MNLTDVNPYRKWKQRARPEKGYNPKTIPPIVLSMAMPETFCFPSPVWESAHAQNIFKGGHWLILTKQDILKIFSRYFLGFFIKWPNYPLLQPPNTSPPNFFPRRRRGYFGHWIYNFYFIFFKKKGKMGSWRVSVREYKTSHLIINFQLF